jgi:long-subunit fatty acid transport protein
MKRILFILIILCCITTSLFAQQGTYNFLLTDVSARAAALNGSFVSMKDDPNVLFYNPASIGTLSVPKVSVSYVNYLMDVNAGTLSYGQYIEGIGSVGAGVIYMNYGSFNRTDELMNVLGTFSATDLALVVGIAAHYDDDILVGINAKFISSSIAEYSSTALAVDLGFLYDIPSQNLSIGGSVLNIGKQLKTYAGVNELLPLDVKFGITKRPEHLPVFLNIDFHQLNESGDKFLDRFSNFTVGAEFLMSKSLRLRVGYNNKQRQELKTGTTVGLGGFSLGVGLVLNEYQIDYAYNSYGDFGGIQRFSLGINL